MFTVEKSSDLHSVLLFDCPFNLPAHCLQWNFKRPLWYTFRFNIYVCVCVCSSPGYRGLEQQHTHWAPLKLQLAFSSVQSSFFLRETHSYVEMAQILTKPLQTRRICLRVRKRTQVMPCSVGLTMLGVVCECVCVYLYKGMQFCSGLLGVDEITANCVTP